MSRQVVGATISVALMVLLFALNLTVVATALPTITGEFHGAALYRWVFSAYAIPVTATTLLYSRIADILGRWRLFIIVVLGFLCGSILCGFSQSMIELVIFLTDTVGRRWIFFLNIPVVAAALGSFLTTHAPTARPQARGRPLRLSDLDFAGSARSRPRSSSFSSPSVLAVIS